MAASSWSHDVNSIKNAIATPSPTLPLRTLSDECRRTGTLCKYSDPRGDGRGQPRYLSAASIGRRQRGDDGERAVSVHRRNKQGNGLTAALLVHCDRRCGVVGWLSGTIDVYELFEAVETLAKHGRLRQPKMAEVRTSRCTTTAASLTCDLAIGFAPSRFRQ